MKCEYCRNDYEPSKYGDYCKHCYAEPKNFPRCVAKNAITGEYYTAEELLLARGDKPLTSTHYNYTQIIRRTSSWPI